MPPRSSAFAPPSFSPVAVIARLRGILADPSDDRVAQIFAGKVFLIRVASAVLALLSQILLARWMGQFEFGIYIYVWTWVLMIGAVSDVGLSSAARRFIPEYIERKAFDRLRGFLTGARWLAFAIATAIALVGAFGVFMLSPWLDHFTVIPLYIACVCLPIYGIVQMQWGIAQSYDWPGLALMPFYIWRQLALTLVMGAVWFAGAPTDAVTAISAAVATAWAVTVVQLFVLNRRLKTKVRPGRKRYDARVWLATSLPILMVEAFYLLLTYVDILVLEQMRSPDEVAAYFAAARLLALVAFVYFAIAGAATHKFSQYDAAGHKRRLAQFFAETVRWTFWPSLAACVLILALGKPLLSLFGANFTSAYSVMFILAIGMLSRAAVGPAERLLNMLGERIPCAIVYAVAFTLNLVLCIALIPSLGIEGAAVATATALVCESLMLFVISRRRLGIHVFILGGGKAGKR